MKISKKQLKLKLEDAFEAGWTMGVATAGYRTSNATFYGAANGAGDMKRYFDTIPWETVA